MKQELEDLERRQKFGQKALLIAIVVILSLFFVTGFFIGRTDDNCKKYKNCGEILSMI